MMEFFDYFNGYTHLLDMLQDWSMEEGSQFQYNTPQLKAWEKVWTTIVDKCNNAIRKDCKSVSKSSAKSSNNKSQEGAKSKSSKEKAPSKASSVKVVKKNVPQKLLAQMPKKKNAKENILFNNPKVVLTPHIAASTTEASIVVAEMVANQLSDFLLNGVKINTV